MAILNNPMGALAAVNVRAGVAVATGGPSTVARHFAQERGDDGFTESSGGGKCTPKNGVKCPADGCQPGQGRTWELTSDCELKWGPCDQANCVDAGDGSVLAHDWSPGE